MKPRSSKSLRRRPHKHGGLRMSYLPPQRLLRVLLQLAHEPKIWIRHPPLSFDIINRIVPSPSVLRHQIRSNDAHTAADALPAVHQHPRLGTRVERVPDEGSGSGQVRSKLREGHVLDSDVHSHGLDWQQGVGDAAGHDSEDVCDSI